MSSAILRRNSSKQGLQNLMRVTAQRSMEDAEEVERERRRRAREAIRRMDSSSGPGESSQENGTPVEDSLSDGSLKPSSPPSLEEDEGFSDWTQRREKRRQQRMQEELSQGAEEEEEEEEKMRRNGPIMSPITSSSIFPNRHQREQGELEGVKMESERRRQQEEEAFSAHRGKRETQREEEDQTKVTSRREEEQQPDTEEAKQDSTNGDTSREEVTSHIHHKTRRTSSSRAAAQAAELAETEAILETEQRLEKIRRSHQEKESQELEQLRHKQVAAEQELEELKRRREERRRIRDGEERRREEEEQLRLAKEEEKRRQMKEDIEKRRMEAAERMKTLSTSGVDGDGTFCPLSPKASTHKSASEEGLTAESTCSITERTESLNRSLKKSNSFRKVLPPVLLAKIDDRLEQYAHAVEETKAAKQGPMDIPGPPEAITTKKNLFEAGEAWSQSPIKGTPSKDTEGLKVGVAGLITQWVKVTPETSGKQSAGKPADVKPGDVMQKKNMWEVIGDSSGRSVQRAKGTSTSKKYKFIVTGHGKYEKVSVDDEHGEEFTNGKSEPYQGDY